MVKYSVDLLTIIGNLVSADAKAGGCALTKPYLNNSSSHFKMGLKNQSKKTFSNYVN